MCFSATASFIAGAVLVTGGVATLRLASRPSEIPFASIPLLFGVQQIVEGLIWLSFRDPSALSNPPLTFTYSLFSHVLWPVYVPFAVRLLETVRWRRQALAVLQIAGIVVGLYLLYFLMRFPITSRVLGQHIVYESPHFYIGVVMALYLSATCIGSLLASSRLIQPTQRSQRTYLLQTNMFSEPFVCKGVTFAYNETTLDPAARAVLDEAAEILDGSDDPQARSQNRRTELIIQDCRVVR